MISHYLNLWKLWKALGGSGRLWETLGSCGGGRGRSVKLWGALGNSGKLWGAQLELCGAWEVVVVVVRANNAFYDNSVIYTSPHRGDTPGVGGMMSRLSFHCRSLLSSSCQHKLPQASSRARASILLPLSQSCSLFGHCSLELALLCARMQHTARNPVRTRGAYGCGRAALRPAWPQACEDISMLIASPL